MGIKEKDIHPIEDTIECVEALARIVKENDLGRLKIRCGEDMTIEIEGKRCPPPHPVMPQMPPMPSVGMGVPGAVTAAAAVSVAAEQPEQISGNIVTSPIIGTFYAAPSPDKPAFVKVGDLINAGDVVCIIESMKLMNEITSEYSGRVAEIYVKNEEPVEFGQKLMRIE